jgi:hypothetical protein
MYIIKYMKNKINNIYHWMMINLPYYIMYKNVWIDTQHKMWIPRWGYSKKQIKNAEKEADNLMNNMKFE